jgi:hypothetical protein
MADREARYPNETDEKYFRRMVKLHSPVEDVPRPKTPKETSWTDEHGLDQASGSGSSSSNPEPVVQDKLKLTKTKPRRIRYPSKVEPEEVDPLHAALFAKPEKPIGYFMKNLDPKKIMITRAGKGMLQYTRIDSLVPMAFENPISPDLGFIPNERYQLYKALEKMNLNNPETIKKIKEACSTKPSKKSDQLSDNKDE